MLGADEDEEPENFWQSFRSRELRTHRVRGRLEVVTSRHICPQTVLSGLDKLSLDFRFESHSGLKVWNLVWTWHLDLRSRFQVWNLVWTSCLDLRSRPQSDSEFCTSGMDLMSGLQFWTSRLDLSLDYRSRPQVWTSGLEFMCGPHGRIDQSVFVSTTRLSCFQDFTSKTSTMGEWWCRG